MEVECKEMLIRALEAVLEQFAFMFGEVADNDGLTADTGKFLHISMGFKGSRSGTVGIAIPAAMGIILASNILGVDEGEEVAEEKSVDALKEFLNIVCGQLLTMVFGEEMVFDLSVPDVRNIDGTGWEDLLQRRGTVVMMVEDQPLLAHAIM